MSLGPPRYEAIEQFVKVVAPVALVLHRSVPHVRGVEVDDLLEADDEQVDALRPVGVHVAQIWTTLASARLQLTHPVCYRLVLERYRPELLPSVHVPCACPHAKGEGVEESLTDGWWEWEMRRRGRWRVARVRWRVCRVYDWWWWWREELLEDGGGQV